jgi:tetratricopeptide (TPR) repeat protein
MDYKQKYLKYKKKYLDLKKGGAKCSHCGKDGTDKKCECGLVYYCNETCQKAAWPTHRVLCRATRDAKAAAISAAEAHSSIEGSDVPPIYNIAKGMEFDVKPPYKCANCGEPKDFESASGCGGCRKVIYCNRSCQRNHHAAHMIECWDAVRDRVIEGDVHKDDIGGETVLKGHLEKAIKKFGEKDDRTHACRHIYGIFLSKLGRIDEAEPLVRKDFEINHEKYGPEHSNTLSSMNSLAILLMKQNKLEEAEHLLKNILKARSSTLNPIEPMTSLAALLMKQNKLEEAEQLMRRIHQINTEAGGTKQSSYFSNMNNLATLLCKRGKYEEAEAIFRETIDGLRGTIGSNHPNTLGTISNFASILTRVGKLGEAESLFREALGRLRDTLGVQNPQTLETMKNFISLLIKQNNLSEAEPLIKELLQINRETLGPKHPETLNDMFSFAVLLLNSERIELAEQLFRETLDGLREISPEDTRITIIIRALTNIRQKKQGK